MDSDLISFETLLTNKDAASATWWTMIYTAIAAIGSVATTVVAIYAAYVAKKELSSWKSHEEMLQMVRLKRAVFAYRQALESKIDPHADKKKHSEEFINKMQPLLSDIFHELALAGLDNEGCLQAKLFNDLAQAHNLHIDGEEKWAVVFKKAIELQKSLKDDV